jgi:hypothetical protein
MAFVAVVCFGLVAIDAWNSWQSRALHLRQMSVATANLARAMAQQADDQIKLADTTLVDIVERIESEGAGPAQVARLREFLAMRVAELPQLDGLHIYDEDGNWIANSRQTWPQNLSNADREYFLFHRTNADRRPHVGIPVKSRTSGRLLAPIRGLLPRPGLSGRFLFSCGLAFSAADFSLLKSAAGRSIFLAVEIWSTDKEVLK